MSGVEASPTAHDSAVLVLSYHGLKIRAHYLFNPAYFCVVQQFVKFKLLARFVELQSFEYDVHPNFIAELKAVRQRFSEQ